MFLSMLGLSVWASNQPLTRGGFGSPLVLTASPSPQDAAEMLRLREENARLMAAKSQLEGQVGHLKTSFDTTNRERLQLVGRVESISAERAKFEQQLKHLSQDLASQQVAASKATEEKAKFEAQIRQLRVDLEETRRAAEPSTTVGMGRRSSSASTASPPSSPIREMVPKAQFDLAQSLARRMEEMSRAAESALEQAQERIVELEGQLALPTVEEQKKEWHEKIEDLQRLIRVLEAIKPPPVPSLNLHSVSRRESMVAAPEEQPLNASFNGSFGHAKRGSIYQRQSPYRRGSVVMRRVVGTSPFQAAIVTSGNASPQEQSLSLFPIFDEDAERHPQWMELEQWKRACEELKRYLAKIKAAEFSDDDFLTAASTSAVVSGEPEMAVVEKLREEMRALSTQKDQMAVTLDAAQKELKRMTDMCIQFSKEIGLDENYLPNVKSAEDSSLVKILAKLGLDVHRVATSNGGLGVGTSRLLKHLNQQLLPLGGEAFIARDGTLNIVPKKVKSKGGCCS